ncbi:hypothetical protein C0Z14_06145 [Rothia aeria]|jgi:trbC/VIRB2 family|nr:hypothetical protein C0Z14_06145 [Rothia aeria]
MKKSVKSLGYGALGAVLSLPFVMSAAHADIKPAPKEMCDGLDTMQAWVTGIAASLGVIGLVIIGAGMFFSHRHESGEGAFKKIGWWIGGAIVVTAAVGIASVFIAGKLNCG